MEIEEGGGVDARRLSAPSRGLTHPSWDLYTGVLHTLKTPATFKRISRHILCRLNLPFRRTNKCASISGACKFNSGPNGTLSRLPFFFPGKRTRGGCIVLIASSHFPPSSLLYCGISQRQRLCLSPALHEILISCAPS